MYERRSGDVISARFFVVVPLVVAVPVVAVV
jgi:hypothetical protein